MKSRILLSAVAVATAAMLGACADVPTDPTADVEFDLSAMYGKGGNGNGASGAIPGVPDDDDFPFDLSEFDNNDSPGVCVKTVPAGKGKGATRTIIKDDFEDGTCPGGFEWVALALPFCEPPDLGEPPPYPEEDNCVCPDPVQDLLPENGAFWAPDGACLFGF